MARQRKRGPVKSTPEKPRPAAAQPAPPDPAAEGIVGLRIIGGKHRGRSLDYSGEHRTRPMKDRVRESLFNLLGPRRCIGRHVIDLFAGTGALALEAISRGATSAIMLERHYPTCQLIEQNARQLGLEAQAKVSFGNTFLWARKLVAPSDIPWVVFCSPPYDFYESRREEMLELLQRLYDAAPEDSTLVVESDERFDFAGLPDRERWNIRDYPPARVGLLDKYTAEEETTL
jgi:16S rRNA (guanine966-N2)-methyltransferase